MDFLRKNALKFLDEAEEAFKKKDYSFTMLFIEQFFQLTLKYLLYKKYGEFPKTHSLKTLFQLTKNDNLINYYKQNLDLLREIELSYIASRYMDVEYSEDIANKALNLAKNFAREFL
ncbi:MAG: HEPN domain-containing protein [archaeon GB-1867-035]|nr:HEPN domain-containing protein [Candidatus Culexmicrobium profundum]